MINNILLRTGLLFFITGMLTGCDNASVNKAAPLVLQGKTMGTFWRAVLVDIPDSQQAELRKKIEKQLIHDDWLLSTYKPNSALSRFNRSRSTQPWPVSEEMAEVVSTALQIGAKTQGLMDVTVGPLVNLWGFGPDKQPIKMPDLRQIKAARELSGLSHLTVIYRSTGQWLQKDIPALYVDLSTLGEGYAADQLSRLLTQNGIHRYLVSVGGAVVTRGINAQGKTWKIAIQKPTDYENSVQEVVNISGYGISTSGSYRNYYELEGKRLSHIIDPKSGRPITHHLVSATVIAPTAMEADAWDTGLMVAGPQKAREIAQQYGLAVYLITKENNGFSVWMSPQFKAFLPINVH